MIRVLSHPHPSTSLRAAPGGISTVLRAYHTHAEAARIQFVGEGEPFDVMAVHAGMSHLHPDAGTPYVSHNHGLYWTADYPASSQEFEHNIAVFDSLRVANLITVPSLWVAQTFWRDMRVRPYILPHGIDLDYWSPPDRPADTPYVLWNKNRTSDVCDPKPVAMLASRAKNVHFLSTFAPDKHPPNILVIGTRPHVEMREIVRSAYVYLSTTKETFGIGILEAMRSGVPVLAYDEGNASTLVRHGIDGYLAKSHNHDDLLQGLHYCLENRDTLGANARKRAGRYGWTTAMEHLWTVYESAHRGIDLQPSVSVVIPCYNKAETVERAVRSAWNQVLAPVRVTVVDNNSTDDFATARRRIEQEFPQTVFLNAEQQGVAHARNLGVFAANTKYVSCLDADDEMLPDFLHTCVMRLESDRTLGLAYTKMEVVLENGSVQVPEWPGEYSYEQFITKRNQVPTCCVFRKDVAVRAGGYRQKYAPDGAGAEDANLWFRMGALGYGGALASSQPLFRYYAGGTVSGNSGYREPDWRGDEPWMRDKLHPFLSIAKPVKTLSHPVHQYDEPYVSVIIPCAAHHVHYLPDALHSLEAQSFRDWEAIVVFDFDQHEKFSLEDLVRLAESYPYLRMTNTGKTGAGASTARNAGVKLARGEMLLFLDADDWLDPECLSKMLAAYRSTGAIVYSDYTGYAKATPEEAGVLHNSGRLIRYDAKRQIAEIRHRAADFDCERAQRQPDRRDDGRVYIWNNITSMVPRVWHDEIGGFDERMQSWEDWDYWLRQAHAGHCFTRIESPLLHYRFHTGRRREFGRQEYATLLDYLYAKYEGKTLMPCGGCGAQSRTMQSQLASALRMRQEVTVQMTTEDLVMVELTDGNRGNHMIVIRDAKNKSHNFGARAHGDQFLMPRSLAMLYPTRFQVIEKAPMETVAATPAPPPKPVLQFDESDGAGSVVTPDDDEDDLDPEDDLDDLYEDDDEPAPAPAPKPVARKAPAKKAPSRKK